MAGKWHDLDTAADILGITSDAVRKRINRGSLEGTKESGRWQVFIEDKRPDNSGQIPDVSDQLIEQLKKENEFLRQQINQQSIIIYNLSEGVKRLEAPKPSIWQRIFNRGG